MFNNIKLSDESFTNVVVSNTLNVRHNVLLGQTKTGIVDEMNLVNDSLDNSKQIVENFEVKVNELNDEFTEFQKNRILTTQDIGLQPVQLLSYENITLDESMSYIKVLCEDSLVNCDVNLHIKTISTPLVYVKLPYPVLLQSYEDEGIKQSQIIPGRILLQYNNLRTTLSSVYIDINQHLDCLIVESPFFNVNDGSIFTDIEVNASIKYTGDISSQINSITPMRFAYETTQDDFKFDWHSAELFDIKALVKWLVIKNRVDLFVNVELNARTFESSTMLVGKLPMEAFTSNVDVVHNAVVSTVPGDKYVVKSVQVVIKSTDDKHFYIYLPENIVDNKTVRLSTYLTYYTKNEYQQEQPFIIKFTPTLEASNVTFSNIDVYDSLNINNNLFFNHNYDLRFHISTDNVTSSYSLNNITAEMLQTDYTFETNAVESVNVSISISDGNKDLVVSPTINLKTDNLI